MGLQQFERRLERMVEGVFARAFRSGLQPVEIGRRLTREMDLRRTMAPRGTIVPNQFLVVLSAADRSRFESIEEELISELVAVAKEHASIEGYVFLGPVTVEMETDEALARGTMLISGEIVKPPDTSKPTLVLPDGKRIELEGQTLVVGRLPDSGLVLADPNVSRHHAEFRPAPGSGDGSSREYQVSDMGSTNGTKVNGIPVGGATLLRDGDSITLGATTIRYERV